jgi:hypothetical protein
MKSNGWMESPASHRLVAKYITASVASQRERLPRIINNCAVYIRKKKQNIKVTQECLVGYNFFFFITASKKERILYSTTK